MVSIVEYEAFYQPFLIILTLFLFILGFYQPFLIYFIMLVVFYSLLSLTFFCYVCRKMVFSHMKVKIIICLLMFGFFLSVTGRNIPSPPPILSSPDVNCDDPQFHPISPPPSLIVNNSNAVPQHSSYEWNILEGIVTFLLILIIVILFCFVEYCYRH